MRDLKLGVVRPAEADHKPLDLGARQVSATFPVTLTEAGRRDLGYLRPKPPPEIDAEAAARVAAALLAGDVVVESVEIRPGIFEHTITGRPRRRLDDLIDEVVARLRAGGAEEV